MEIMTEAIHESKKNNNVVRFISHNELNKRAIKEIENGTLVGLYYTKKGNIRGFNVWNETFKASKS